MMERLMLLTFLVTTTVLCHEPFQMIFEWKSFDFHWPSEEQRKYDILRGEYIPENILITTVKFWKGKMYLTLPRWKVGVPVTLGVTSSKPINGHQVTAPKLDAFPSWDMQKLDYCAAFQLVHSIEIDPKGRMWVLDSGRPIFLRQYKADCPPRLVILDLEDNDKILRTYEFPEHVTNRRDAYLNDIVLDHENGGMAYITDTSSTDPGIIVYSLKDNNSWKVRHDSMKAKPETKSFMVANTRLKNPIDVDGIALSPASNRDRQVYYSPLFSFHLYSVPASVLKNNVTNIDQYVKELGRKFSQTDGMMMSATGVLYFGLLADDAIATWDTKNTTSFTVGQRVIWRDHVLTQWPDSFAFDEDGNVWCVTNMLQNFLIKHVDVNVSIRLIRSHVGVRSYQYYENGTAPALPDITSSANSVRFVFAALLLVALILIAK
ncbi:protein yellow-like [Monomorium pharaonis]|uniref:protein yellow-like n=1 Tax=Monomorium pharaonis TaxID=307658 RepID=UPI00063F271E|nr:protein yellow-like [Monomorium pharaonis]XP_036144716.1 protein yellow-like [Monomorium pharaonis]XP_036144727.1 protein yellow-like [Monomorium pharaonis]